MGARSSLISTKSNPPNHTFVRNLNRNARDIEDVEQHPHQFIIAMDSDVQEVPLSKPLTTPLTKALQSDHVHVPANDPLEPLEKALENVCTTLATLGENVIDFSYDSQDVIFSKVNELVRDFQQVVKSSDGIQADIPVEVLEAIDKGRNPEQVTYQLLESCAEANNVSRGKLRAMRAFRDELNKCAKEMGDETDTKGKPENLEVNESLAKRTNGFDTMDVG